jgi:hypothetical protein
MKRWHWIALAIITAASMVIEFFFIETKHGHWWDIIPGFYMIFGFIGCAVIIFASKAYGKMLVQKEEKYYDE